MSLLTEEEARKIISARNLKSGDTLCLPENRIITPSAKTYLNDKNIAVKFEEESKTENSSFTTLFGATLSEKPEFMTHLRGNVLVFKDHPRIVLRGMIDYLESEILKVQLVTDRLGHKKLTEDLEEILAFIRGLLRCEVLEEPVAEFRLQGMDAADLREHSHHPSQYYGIKHFLPSYKQGEVVVLLNNLRTITRQVELSAFKAFKTQQGEVERNDIIKAFNRLSSLFWIMMFKYLSKKYD